MIFTIGLIIFSIVGWIAIWTVDEVNRRNNEREN